METKKKKKDKKNNLDHLLCLQESRSFPESYPELPKHDTVESSILQKHILELATMLDAQSLFWDDSLEAY